jgi:hypothetical protein
MAPIYIVANCENSRKESRRWESLVSSLAERHVPNLSLEISATPFFLLAFQLIIAISEAVSELASDYSGCSSLIVSATLPADREESFSSGTVALDHELTETFGEEGVYRRT